MAKLYNLARMSTATTGTGTITLGAAVSGCLSFSSAGVQDGDVVSYGIEDGANSEVGRGTYTASGTTLARTTVLKSTNGGSAINLSGDAQVFIVALAEDFNTRQIYPEFTRPVDGDFAWINQGGASVTVNDNGGIHLIAPASASTSYRIRKKSAPATPYTITAAFLFSVHSVDFQQAGLLFRQSSDGKLVTMAIGTGNTFPGDIEFVSQDYTNETTFSASNATQDAFPFGVVWLRIADNGTNRVIGYSFDGYNFVTLLTEGRTTFLTADEVGFFCNTSSSAIQAACTLLSWAQS